MENNKGVTGVSVEEYKKQLIKALDSDDIRVFTEDVSVMLGYTEDNSNFKTRLGFVDTGKMLLHVRGHVGSREIYTFLTGGELARQILNEPDTW